MTGTWTQVPGGYWKFVSEGRLYRGEWAYIVNPYADAAKGQRPADWFYFDLEGHMLTGWQWIRAADGETYCYYLNEAADGTKGAMFSGTTTPDGYRVDDSGAWIVNGVRQTKQENERTHGGNGP